MTLCPRDDRLFLLVRVGRCPPRMTMIALQYGMLAGRGGFGLEGWISRWRMMREWKTRLSSTAVTYLLACHRSTGATGGPGSWCPLYGVGAKRPSSGGASLEWAPRAPANCTGSSRPWHRYRMQTYTFITVSSTNTNTNTNKKDHQNCQKPITIFELSCVS